MNCEVEMTSSRPPNIRGPAESAGRDGGSEVLENTTFLTTTEEDSNETAVLSFVFTLVQGEKRPRNTVNRLFNLLVSLNMFP